MKGKEIKVSLDERRQKIGFKTRIEKILSKHQQQQRFLDILLKVK